MCFNYKNAVSYQTVQRAYRENVLFFLYLCLQQRNQGLSQQWLYFLKLSVGA